MPSPPNKKPSDPDLEFVDTNDEPTGKYSPPALGGRAAPKPSAPGTRKEPETMPAPNKAGARKTSRANDPAIADSGATRDPKRGPPQSNEDRSTMPAPSAPPRPRVQTDDLEAPLFGPGRTDTTSDRPTREVPPDGPRRAVNEKIAPLPPRLPTLGPEPEFSFGLEDPPTAPLSNPPGPPMPTRQRNPVDDDLSWDVRGGADYGQPDEENHAASVSISIEPESGDAHTLADRASGRPAFLARDDPRRELDERFALGDFSGALVIADSILAEAPSDVDVTRIAESCRSKLEQMYSSRLGDLRQIPAMAVPRAELKWLSLDHRAGFILSLVDGNSNIEEIMDVAGMSGLEVLRTLFDLQVQRVIEFKSPKGARR